MQNIEIIADELFSKIRGRFPGVTIGDAEGNVTSEPKQARFFEFPFREAKADVGKVSISLSEEDGVVVMHNKDVAENNVSKSTWYDFLKELRQFSKKRLLNFTTRDITKSNLEKRDYKYLAQRSGDSNMTESKLYGTSRISYQDVGEARLIIKHNESIDQTSPTGRNRSIGKIYVESPQGERFMYPFKHLSGARAMARHVAEGGNAYDEFGKHITSLSEELAKLRKFKNYMGRSSVMAESLSEYMDVVKERVVTVKKTIESLQKPKFYAEAFEAFAPVVMEDVPADVAENWIDQLTIRQFNEELSDVFPYIYKLVSEASKAEDINPDDLDETGLQRYTGIKKYGKKGFEELQKAGREGAGEEEKGKIKDKHLSKEEIEIESAFEQMMGQFAEAPAQEVSNCCGAPIQGEVDSGHGRCSQCKEMASVETDESFDPNAEPSQADLAMEEFMDTYEKGGEKALAAALRISEEELDQDINEWCAAHGKHADDDRDEAIEGVVQELVDDTNFDEGNAFAQKVRQAKANGKKKGDKVDGPDGDEITLEKDEKTPLGEFILSYFDRDNGSFPKGETAVLTMIEKDYGEEYITPAKQFIERINQTFEEYQMRVQPQQMENPEFDRIRELAGLR
ncbi:MAG: hypothetical protein ACKVJK_01210 [Methylophagaceae bacterium]